MIKTYARKLENIRNNCFDSASSTMMSKRFASSRSPSVKRSQRGTSQKTTPITLLEDPNYVSKKKAAVKKVSKKLKIDKGGSVAKKAMALAYAQGYYNQHMMLENEEDSQVDIRISGQQQELLSHTTTALEQILNQN